jgi:hypothetical protein
MGRLPATWANRVIIGRTPYEFSGELALASLTAPQQFPDATFLNGVDRPFEIHRMIPRLYALDSNSVLLPTQSDQELLAGLIRMSLQDLSLDLMLTKRSTLIGTLTKGSSERTWEWADPHTIERSNQLIVTVESVTYPAIESLSTIRVAITFEGFLLTLAPPSENR